MIDKEQYIDLVGAYVTSMWQALQDVVAIRRTARNNAAMYENFEFLASLAATRMDRPQHYPRGVRPLMPEEEWRARAERARKEARGITSDFPSNVIS